MILDCMKFVLLEVVRMIKFCDFCKEVAVYDGKTRMGPWAFMCEYHFMMNGIGLGLGKGQRLSEVNKK